MRVVIDYLQSTQLHVIIYNITVLHSDLYPQSLPLGHFHLKTGMGFMHGRKTEALKCMSCPIKHCPCVNIHGGGAQWTVRGEPCLGPAMMRALETQTATKSVKMGICGTNKREVVGELCRGNQLWEAEQGGLGSRALPIQERMQHMGNHEWVTEAGDAGTWKQEGTGRVLRCPGEGHRCTRYRS